MDKRKDIIIAELVRLLQHSHLRNKTLCSLLSSPQLAHLEQLDHAEDQVCHLQSTNTNLSTTVLQQEAHVAQLSGKLIKLESDNKELRVALNNLKWGFGAREAELLLRLGEFTGASIGLFHSHVCAEGAMKECAQELCGVLELLEEDFRKPTLSPTPTSSATTISPSSNHDCSDSSENLLTQQKMELHAEGKMDADVRGLALVELGATRGFLTHAPDLPSPTLGSRGFLHDAVPTAAATTNAVFEASTACEDEVRLLRVRVAYLEAELVMRVERESAMLEAFRQMEEEGKVG